MRTASLVYRMLLIRTSSERMPMDEGNGTTSESDETFTRTHGRICASIYKLTIPYPNPYHSFPGNQVVPSVEYCEICRIHGHGPRQYLIIYKYSMVLNIVHSKFCAYTTHATNKCRSLDALADILDQTSFRVNETPQGLGRG
jgi:hypothetical protein